MTYRLPVEWAEVRFQTEPVSVSPVEAVAEAVSQRFEASRQAQPLWQARAIRERLRVVRAFREILASSAGAAAHLLAPPDPQEALTSQVLPLLEACRFLEGSAGKILRPKSLGWSGRPLWLMGVSHRVSREPHGVVLVIGPVNYPLFLPGIQALQALVAGNGVLIKPGRGGRSAAMSFAAMLYQAGLPLGLLGILPEEPEAADLAMRAGVDKVLLTGSANAGRAILGRAAERLTPCTLELSGCDAVFVLPDADLNLAANSVAFGATLNQGQTCIAPRRVFVWDPRGGDFTAALIRAVQKRSEIVLDRESHWRLADAVKRAIQGGARLVHGAIGPEGMLRGPIILAGVRAEMSVATEDFWAPIISIIPVAGDAEALNGYKVSPYALGASIFSESATAAAEFAQRLRAGSICINDLIVPTADPRIPFGGTRQSGFGVTRGEEGLLEMTWPKVVSTRTGAGRPHLDPGARRHFRLILNFTRLMHGSLSERWQALRRMSFGTGTYSKDL